jgi:hypothetical protein
MVPHAVTKYSTHLGVRIPAVRQQAMIGHADADVDREEVHDCEDCKVLPGEAEERGDSANVEEAHDDGGDPVDAALLVLAAHAKVLLDLLRDLSGDGKIGHRKIANGGLVSGCGRDSLGRKYGRRHKFCNPSCCSIDNANRIAKARL